MVPMPTDDPRPGKRARPTEAAAEASAPAPTTTRDDPAFARYWDPKLHAAARKRLENFEKVMAEMDKKYPLPKDPRKRRKLNDHRYLYDKFGLPK